MCAVGMNPSFGVQNVIKRVRCMIVVHGVGVIWIPENMIIIYLSAIFPRFENPILIF